MQDWWAISVNMYPSILVCLLKNEISAAWEDPVTILIYKRVDSTDLENQLAYYPRYLNYENYHKAPRKEILNVPAPGASRLKERIQHHHRLTYK